MESSPHVNDYFNRLEVDGEENGEFIDHWDTGELLFLASSVLRSDRNWVSVARSIKPFGEQTRPSDWYTPKNCALQYTKLLSEIDEESKKKTLPRTERETSEVMLVKNLTDKRLTELDWLNQQTKGTANILKSYIEMVDCGDFDDQLDDLIKQVEEKEKSEEENFTEYVMKRESLNAAKKLNKSRITKGKNTSRASDARKKLSFSDLSEDSSTSQATVEEVIKNIKKEMDADDEASTKLIRIKSETDPPITLNALLDSKVSNPSSIAPTSPLLTSLLRSITSTTSPSHTLSSIHSSIKESDHGEGTDASKYEELMRSREVSPRGSLQQTPRPTPSSSPLLNSLLKNSPSSSTPLQLSPMKDIKISPKAVSSPQPFFNPTSALATAAAQQLAVATSTNPPFFQQHDVSETRKSSLQHSPISSACLSAPTLSKLLEMPPSTPGRLPPLILDSHLASTANFSHADSTSKHTKKQPDLKSSILESLAKDTIDNCPSDSSVLQKSSVSYSQADKKRAAAFSESSKTAESKPSAFQLLTALEEVPREKISILEAVCDDINQVFEVKEVKQEVIEDDDQSQTLMDVGDPLLPTTPLDSPSVDSIKEDGDETKDSVSTTIRQPLTFSDGLKENAAIPINTKTVAEVLHTNVSAVTEKSPVKSSSDVLDEDKGTPGKRFYKSRSSSKNEDTPEKISDVSSSLPSSKKTGPNIKAEQSTPMKDNLAEKEDSDAIIEKDPKASKDSDSKVPPSKRPRLQERSSTEKAELSEDETTAVRRSGRRGRTPVQENKRGRGRAPKSTPVKQIEPKDQYEFTESTEENSVGYQATNTLCYMPRLKEEDSKTKSAQEVEEAESSAGLLASEKKTATTPRHKQVKTSAQLLTAKKNLFGADDEKVSDSLTSDDASSHVLSEDKLKKWEEACEKKDEPLKETAEISRRNSRSSDSPQKKCQQSKRISLGGKIVPARKERKVSNVDMEELSMESRDSETSLQEKDIPEGKDARVAIDMEVDTNDSHSSSIAAESDDRQLDEMEGSLQGSIATDFSPPPTNETKDDKETLPFEKQDWFQGVSPKSSELISQSSEESEEYESDNWDNHSISTNKSTSLSSGAPSRLTRKERESPQYKAWKKAISIVLREASCHKNANIFLQKVTNDVAPGYLSVVHRPMDLSLIKKNIDNGVIKTTEEFLRDMLLMFQNAIMYNSSEHLVYKMAVEMQKDVIEQIKAFLFTQGSVKDKAAEPVTSLRGARTVKVQAQKGLGKQTPTPSEN